MENKKTARVIFIGIITYMLLSWIIVAGNFNESIYTNTGHNQIGLFDLVLAPINLLNSFIEAKTQNSAGIVSSFSYINTVLAFVAIGVYYAVLNKTGAYQVLIDKLSNKLNKHKNITLISVGVLFYLISVLTGLNLVLFFTLPFIVTILMKLKFNKPTIFTATIGSMLIGRISCLFDSNVNGLNRMLYQTKIIELVPSRIIFFLLLLIVVIAVLLLTVEREVSKEEEIPLLEESDNKKTNFIPIIIISTIIFIILSVCMYNWYYMFNIKTLSDGYNNIMGANINKYNYMKNIFGMTEEFGFWSGFTMSSLLILGTFVIKFIYNIKFDNYIEGVKTGLSKMLPTVALSFLCLTTVVFSIYYSDSFIYSIINRVMKMFEDNVVIGTFISTFIHSFTVNDYFATMTTISPALISTYGQDNISLITFISQITYGITSLISPFSLYLVASLSYLGLSYTKWLKYIFKALFVVTLLSIVILFITVRFF